MLTNNLILTFSGHDTLRPLGTQFRLFTNSVCNTKHHKTLSCNWPLQHLTGLNRHGQHVCLDEVLFSLHKRSPSMSLLSHQLTGINSINKASFNEALRSYPHEVLLMSLGSPYVFTGSGTLIGSKGLHVLCLRVMMPRLAC